ncbi:hypothetical protein Tsubulata_036574 [Turnera subulata]|uniref:Major facilitator superfamily (MFS) profile domain-containing protein n=1 Tax=Turnera subulata TaxID=218843 RepID=A0A9Q0F8M7_9ROSI|nr:hypothetical protein Tsubulata_036574 [Turnera subulata]
MSSNQLGVLNALDVAKTQWYHFTAVVIAEMGFFIEPTIYFSIPGAAKPSTLPPNVAAAVNASTASQADYVWRIILMFGALPAILTYYWRMKMPETARYTALVAKNAKQAASDMSKVLQMELLPEEEKIERLNQESSSSFCDFTKEFARRHGLHLLGTTSCWFLLDIAHYSNNLFQKGIYRAIGWIPPVETMNAIHEVYLVSRAQTLIALCDAVPGYWFTAALIDYLGRFTIQLMGFFFMTVFMFALAIPYHHWTLKARRIGFLVMYSLTFFFANFGPNATTFVVPAEIFPARLRST